MGADISLPLSKIPNQSTIDGRTKNTIVLMNKILEFILRDAEIADMVSLASPQGCKKWIIVAETQLTKLFDRISIQPDAGKDGILYLKRLDDIEKKSAEKVNVGDTKLEHKDYCNVLAFFFIRLFQVVGALALSIIDTEIPREDYGEKEVVSFQGRRGVPFFQSVEDQKPWYKRGFRGGQVYNGLPILSQYINNKQIVVPITTKSGTTAYTKGDVISQFIVNELSNVYTINDIRTNRCIDFIFTSDSLIITNIRIDGCSSMNTLPIQMKKNYDSGMPLSIDNKMFIDYFFDLFNIIGRIENYNPIMQLFILQKYIDSNKKIIGTEILWNEDFVNPEFSITKDISVQDEPKKIKIKINFKIYLTADNNKYDLLVKDIVIKPDYISIDTRRSKQTVNTSNNSEEDENDDEDAANPESITFTLNNNFVPVTKHKSTIPKYLKRRIETLLARAEKAAKEGYVKSTQGYARPLSDVKTSSPLKYTELWTTLLQKPPIKSFCTARALQLLNASGLSGATTSTVQTLAYSTKFPLLSNKSLPIPGQSIVSAAPFKSLAALYTPSDTILNTINPKKASVVPKTPLDNSGKRNKSIGQLIASFVDLSANDISNFLDSTGNMQIDKIKEPVYKGNATINDATIIKGLKNQAIKLFAKQFSHTKKVEAILKKLFIIDTTITLNPRILAKGINGIEEVAIEARELLSEYYSTCQIEYNTGVKLMQTSQKLNPPSAPSKI